MAEAIKIIVDKKELFKGTLAADLQDAISECTEKIDEIQWHRSTLVQSLWSGFDNLAHVMTFHWECEKSPIGWCVYHHWDDLAHDDCIFCHEPDERK